MSIEYCAHSVIGMKLPKKDLFINKTARSCSHNIDDNMKFCPECGKTAKITVKDRIKEYNDYNDTLCGLTLISDGYEKYVVVTLDNGTSITVNYEHTVKQLLISDIERIKYQIQSKLEPIGLWDAAMFGIWSVMDWY